MHAENLASIAEAMILLQVSKVNCSLGLFATHHGSEGIMHEAYDHEGRELTNTR